MALGSKKLNAHKRKVGMSTDQHALLSAVPRSLAAYNEYSRDELENTISLLSLAYHVRGYARGMAVCASEPVAFSCGGTICAINFAYCFKWAGSKHLLSFAKRDRRAGSRGSRARKVLPQKGRPGLNPGFAVRERPMLCHA